MLASLRLTAVRRALVIMLMILSGFIAVQRAQSVVNGIEHALAIEHAAPALELASADHDHDLDHDDDHDRADGDGLAGAAGQDPSPGPHHHHSEAPQLAALVAPVTVEVSVSRSAALFMLAETGSPQSRIFGLERPPKALSDRA